MTATKEAHVFSLTLTWKTAWTDIAEVGIITMAKLLRGRNSMAKPQLAQVEATTRKKTVRRSVYVTQVFVLHEIVLKYCE